jgi:hypothetical protein
MNQLSIGKLSHVEGRILTIIEASIVDKQQCEAVKSLVRQELGVLYSWCSYIPPVTGSTEKVEQG